MRANLRTCARGANGQMNSVGTVQSSRVEGFTKICRNGQSLLLEWTIEEANLHQRLRRNIQEDV